MLPICKAKCKDSESRAQKKQVYSIFCTETFPIFVVTTKIVQIKIK